MGESHNHGPASLSSINRAFYIGIVLNTIFTAIEFIVGYRYNSLSLIADASHNLSDVASLIISLMGMKLAQKAANLSYTYGYKKASIIASLINAVLLIFIVFSIFKEAIERIQLVQELPGVVIIITALIGVGINTLSAYLFYKGQKQDINIKGAFIHLLVDALVSLGVVVAGILIYYTNWNLIDPIMSFVIGLVIIISTWSLLKESIKLTLNGVPKDLNVDKVKKLILKDGKIVAVKHLHVWALGSNENALTCHLILDKNYSLDEITVIKEAVRHELLHQNIHHATLEFENLNDKTLDSCTSN